MKDDHTTNSQKLKRLPGCRARSNKNLIRLLEPQSHENQRVQSELLWICIPGSGGSAGTGRNMNVIMLEGTGFVEIHSRSLYA